MKNKLCKQYISQIKSFFPIVSKKERKYINNISNSVNEYCEDNPKATLNEIYDVFGSPQETINSYMLANADDISSYFKKVNIAKWLKRISILLMAAIIVLTSALLLRMYKDYKVFEDETMFFNEIKIE